MKRRIVRTGRKSPQPKELLPIGAKRRNWLQTLISDGWWLVRHPDLATCVAMSDRIGTELQLYAAP